MTNERDRRRGHPTGDHPGEHALRVEVPGESDPRGAGQRVWLDAVTIEP